MPLFCNGSLAKQVADLPGAEPTSLHMPAGNYACQITAQRMQERQAAAAAAAAVAGLAHPTVQPSVHLACQFQALK
jgi:hypothetical protein